MNTKDIFQSLKVISGTIYYYNRELSELEKHNMLDSNEYKETLIKINKLEQIEDALINYVDSKGENEIENLCAYAQVDMVGKNKVEKVIHDPSYIISNKIHKNDIIDMRISYKATLKYVKYILKDDETNVFNIYEPIKNKNFIKILENDYKLNEFDLYKNMMIDAKYDYEYINCKNSTKKVNELSKEEDNHYKSLMLSELYQYAVKFSKYNQKTLTNKINRRRFILNIDYIRACLCDLNEEDINNFKLYLLINSEELDDKNGLDIFMNAIDICIEDKQNGEEYKRKLN